MGGGRSGICCGRCVFIGRGGPPLLAWPERSRYVACDICSCVASHCSVVAWNMAAMRSASSPVAAAEGSTGPERPPTDGCGAEEELAVAPSKRIVIGPRYIDEPAGLTPEALAVPE